MRQAHYLGHLLGSCSLVEGNNRAGTHEVYAYTCQSNQSKAITNIIALFYHTHDLNISFNGSLFAMLKQNARDKDKGCERQ